MAGFSRDAFAPDAFDVGAHQFETGFSFAKRTMLRRSVVTILSALTRPAGYLRGVVPHGGVVRSWTDELGIDLLVRAAGPTPAIAVTVGTAAESETTVGVQVMAEDVELILYFVSQHSRGLLERLEPDIAAQADSHADPGLEIAMEHATELLLGQYPVKGSVKLKQLRKSREDELVTRPELTVYMQTWRCEMQQRAVSKEFRTAPQLLNSIRHRITTTAAEVLRPAAATDSTSLDVDNDDLDP
jgi:hypothetical protein